MKYDNVLILSGPQGTCKSTLLEKMGSPWFTDSLLTFNGKDAMEMLQGKWVVEIAELHAFRNTSVDRTKQFMSSSCDRYRPAFGRRATDHPRRCTFFGTVNPKEFLRDPTGGRRFWPVFIRVNPPRKDVWKQLPGERDQIWAEAVIRWKLGEPLYLTDVLLREAEAIQEAAREADTREGLILDFLEKPVPKDWQNWPIERRRIFWNGSVTGDLELVPRDRVCAIEIWCELFGKDQADAQQRDTRQINAVLENAPEWERIPKPAKFGPYGSQRGFRNVDKHSNYI